ncbi:MAG: ABC transporter substrate-binding protein [Candidatus Poribacteria bacterium]|nr:ABC transporter substrate-binding protein [Candidatus Poribacteria bacterium]
MTNIKNSVLAVAMAVLIAGLTGCDRLLNIISDGDMPRLDGEIPQFEGLHGEISIGVVYPSPVGKFEPVRTRLEHGLELALEEINNAQLGDARIRLIAEEDSNNVDGAVEAFNKLIHEDGVPAIIGPLTSSQSEAAFPIAQENRVVAFSSTSFATGLSALGDYIFRVSLTSDALIPHLVEVTHTKLGYQRAAIITDETDLVSQSGDRAFRDALSENGVTIVSREGWRPGETDLAAHLTRIKESDPQVVFIATVPNDMPEIMIMGRELGLPFSVPYIVAQVSNDEVHAASGAAEGLFSTSNWMSTTSTPMNQAFNRNYHAKFGREPNTWAAQSYTTLYILAEAIANARTADSESIRNALADIRDLDTVLGSFSFDAVGDALYDPTIIVVENGELKRLE